MERAAVEWGEAFEPPLTLRRLVAQGRALTGRARDDEAVRAVVDQVVGELAEPVVVDRSVGVERRNDGG